MNRSIEFRIWHKRLKAMRSVIGIMLGHHCWFDAIQDDDSRAFSPTLRETGCSLLSEVELMQFTGLLDRNGKKIFEGDIVRALFDFGPAGERQEVTVVMVGNFGPNLQQWTFTDSEYLPEIIGNIYENPELFPAPEM